MAHVRHINFQRHGVFCVRHTMVQANKTEQPESLLVPEAGILLE